MKYSMRSLFMDRMESQPSQWLYLDFSDYSVSGILSVKT